MQVIEFARRLDAKTAAERLNLQNSLLISLLAGNLTVETGSTATASATTKSGTFSADDFSSHRNTHRNGLAPFAIWLPHGSPCRQQVTAGRSKVPEGAGH